MFYYVKLVFQSFYDFEAIKNYVKKGQGNGAMLMAVVALMASLIMGGLITQAFLSIDKNQIKNEIEASFNDVPELNITDGKLLANDGIIEKYDLGEGLFLTIDTLNASPTVSQMRDSAIYVTKTEVYLNDKNNSRVQPISWKELQEATGENPLIINGEKLAEWVMMLIHYTKAYVIILTFVVVWLWFWVGNIIIAALSRVFGSILYSETKKLEQYERRRLATIAVIPPMVLFDVAAYTTGIPGGLVRWIAIIVIAIILMKQYYSAMVGKKTEVVVEDSVKPVAVAKPEEKKKVAVKKPAVAKKPAAKAKPVASSEPVVAAKKAPVKKAVVKKPAVKK